MSEAKNPKVKITDLVGICTAELDVSGLLSLVTLITAEILHQVRPESRADLILRISTETLRASRRFDELCQKPTCPGQAWKTHKQEEAEK